ncbi:MAG: ABC transporter transmembrane domain-containing protein [Eggerthella lenta]
MSERFREATVKTLRIATLSGSVLDLISTLSLAAVAIMLGFRLVDGSIAFFPALFVLVLVPEYFKPIREFASDYHASLDGKNALASIQGIIASAEGVLTPRATRLRRRTAFPSGAKIRRSATAALASAQALLRSAGRLARAPSGPAARQEHARTCWAASRPQRGHGARCRAAAGRPARASWQRQVLISRRTCTCSTPAARQHHAPTAPMPTTMRLRAVEVVGLGDLVAELPDGLDTLVGEGAARCRAARRSARAGVPRPLAAHPAVRRTHGAPRHRDRVGAEGAHAAAHGRPSRGVRHAPAALGARHGCRAGDGGRARGRVRRAEGACRARRRVRALGVSVGRRRAMSREGEAVQGAVPREEGFASVLRRDAWVKPFFFRYRKALALALFLGLLTFGFASALMFTSGYLVSASAVVETILFLHLPLIFVRIFGVGKPILQYLERLTSHDWVLRMTSGLRLKLYRALERDAVFFRATHRTGDVLGLLAEDIGHIQNLYLRTVFPTVTAWLLFVVLVACLGWFSLWLALAMLLVLGTAVFLVPLVSVLANAARQARHKQMKNELYAELADNVLGVSDWVFAGRGEEYLTRHKERELRMRDVQERMERFGRRCDVVLQALFGICAVLLLVWAGGRFGGEGATRPTGSPRSCWASSRSSTRSAPLSSAAVEAGAYRDSIARLNDLPTPARRSRPRACRGARSTCGLTRGVPLSRHVA